MQGGGILPPLPLLNDIPVMQESLKLFHRKENTEKAALFRHFNSPRAESGFLASSVTDSNEGGGNPCIIYNKDTPSLYA